MDAVFRLEIDNPVLATIFNDLEMEEGGSSENPIVLDQQEDRGTVLRQLQCLNARLILPVCSEVVLLGDGLKNVPNRIVGLGMNNLLVCVGEKLLTIK